MPLSRVIYLYSDSASHTHGLQKRLRHGDMCYLHQYCLEQGSSSEIAQSGIRRRADYIVHIYNEENIATITEGHLSQSIDTHPGRVLVVCEDDLAYEVYARVSGNYAGALWALDLELAAIAMRDGVQGLVGEENVEVEP